MWAGTEHIAILKDDTWFPITVYDPDDRAASCNLVTINGTILQHISERNKIVRVKVITLWLVNWGFSVIFVKVGVHFLNTAVILIISCSAWTFIVVMIIPTWRKSSVQAELLYMSLLSSKSSSLPALTWYVLSECAETEDSQDLKMELDSTLQLSDWSSN